MPSTNNRRNLSNITRDIVLTSMSFLAAFTLRDVVIQSYHKVTNNSKKITYLLVFSLFIIGLTILITYLWQ